jgi:hypothetical protein
MILWGTHSPGSVALDGTNFAESAKFTVLDVIWQMRENGWSTGFALSIFNRERIVYGDISYQGIRCFG